MAMTGPDRFASTRSATSCPDQTPCCSACEPVFLRDRAYLPDLARALTNLGVFLSKVGRDEEASQIQEELGGLATP